MHARMHAGVPPDALMREMEAVDTEGQPILAALGQY